MLSFTKRSEILFLQKGHAVQGFMFFYIIFKLYIICLS